MDPLHFQHLNNAMNNKIFIVPDYQRDYAWQKAEWTTLTEDIDVLYERDAFGNDESHFIGSIVLIPLDADISRAAKEIEENSKLNKFDKFNIIDGQQRITTLSILLISIRDYAEKNKIELDEAQDIAASLNTGKEIAIKTKYLSCIFRSSTPKTATTLFFTMRIFHTMAGEQEREESKVQKTFLTKKLRAYLQILKTSKMLSINM